MSLSLESASVVVFLALGRPALANSDIKVDCFLVLSTVIGVRTQMFSFAVQFTSKVYAYNKFASLY